MFDTYIQIKIDTGDRSIKKINSTSNPKINNKCIEVFICEFNVTDVTIGSEFDLGYVYEKIDVPYSILS